MLPVSDEPRPALRGTIAECEQRFRAARSVLAKIQGDPRTDQPLRSWMSEGDTHYPSQLVGHSLRHLLGQELRSLQQVDGVGEKKLRKLVALIERAIEDLLRDPGNAPTTGIAVADLNIEEWLKAGAAIRAHRLDHLPIGHFALSLRELPFPYWSRPLRSVLDREGIEALDSSIRRRIGGVIRRLGRILLHEEPCEMSLIPTVPNIRRAAVWIESVISGGEPPTESEVRSEFVAPLLDQLERDTSPAEREMMQLRIGWEDEPRTLQQIGEQYSVSRQRIDQLLSRGRGAMCVRWPEGVRQIRQLLQSPAMMHTEQSVWRLTQRLAEHMFGGPQSGGCVFETVSEKWRAAGENHLTPMTAERIEQWSARNCPDIEPSKVAAWVRSRFPSCRIGKQQVWFSDSEADRLLRFLLECDQSVHPDDLPLADPRPKCCGARDTAAAEDPQRFRQARIQRWIRSDPRVIVNDFGRLVAACRCGFHQDGEAWFVRLAATKHSRPTVKHLPLSMVETMLVRGMLDYGISGAPLAGVHRFANETLTALFGAQLHRDVTPIALGAMLVAHSDGRIRRMEEGRLRWDADGEDPPARGLRWWVRAITRGFGRPMRTDELTELLRLHYQDSDERVVRDSLRVCESPRSDGLSSLLDLGHDTPAMAIPAGWKPGDEDPGVSEGVLELASELRNEPRPGRLTQEELAKVAWLAKLVAADGGESPPVAVGRPDASAERFLSEPRPVWTDGKFGFRCQVELPSFRLDEHEKTFQIVVDGKILSVLLRQSDGSLLAQPDSFAIPLTDRIVEVELRRPSGRVEAVQWLELWSADADDDVDGYVVKTGERISPWSDAFSGRETFLIYSSDLRIEPPMQSVAVLGNGTRSVVQLPPHTDVRLLLRDQVLWESCPPLGDVRRKSVRVGLEFHPPAAPKKFRVRITHPAEFRVVELLHRRQGYQVEPRTECVSHSEWIELTQDLRKAQSVAFRVRLTKGDEAALLPFRRQLRLPGQFWRRSDAWEPVAASAVCNASRVSRIPFRLTPPSRNSNMSRWYVFEGQRKVASVRESLQFLRNLQGWGASLVLRSGPYNSTETDQVLLRSVVSHGLLQQVDFVHERTVRICVAGRIQPDEQHEFVILDAGGDVHSVPVSEGAFDPLSSDIWESWCATADVRETKTVTEWRAVLPPGTDVEDIVAVGITYAGVWLGGCWAKDWLRLLKPDAATDSPAVWATKVAEALYRFRLPVLSADVSKEVRGFARDHAVPVLSAWLTCLRSVGRDQASRDGWLEVVRSNFGDWHPSSEEAIALNTILEELTPPGTRLPLSVVVSEVCPVHPLLAARLVRAWLASDEASQAAVRDRRALLQALQEQLLAGRTHEELVLRVAQDVSGSVVQDVSGNGSRYRGPMDFVRHPKDGLLTKALLLFDGFGGSEL